jgi:uncharacterized protein (TIGR02996 family)
VPELDGFLASINAEPDADAPRLVFADWLDDHGDTRGELVRLQVRRARLPRGDPGLLWVTLDRTEQELLDRHAVGWLGPLYRPAISWEYVRGLLHVEVEAQAFLAEPVETNEARRAFAWVERLRFRGLTQSLAVALAHFPYLVHLRALDLAENPIGTEGITELAATSFLAPVELLDLHGCRIGPGGAAALGVASSQAWRLTRLVLWDNQIGPGGASQLAASSCVARLNDLDLAYNNIGDEGAQALADSLHLTNLRVLDLRSNRIGDRGAEALAYSPYLTGLRLLQLHHNEIGAKGVEVLRQAFGNRVVVQPPRPRGGNWL